MDFVTWYLDRGCSIHMEGNNKLFIEFDLRKKTKVKFVDNNSMEVECMKSVLVYL